MVEKRRIFFVLKIYCWKTSYCCWSSINWWKRWRYSWFYNKKWCWSVDVLFSFIFNFIILLFWFRYLAKTFNQVNSYIKPDWVLFLGDIFDEGLSASDDEFQRYFQRFNSIFNYKNYQQRSLIIPGDNDVGGEYYGDKQPILRQRFRNYFGRTIALFRQNDIEYLKVLFSEKFYILKKDFFF